MHVDGKSESIYTLQLPNIVQLLLHKNCYSVNVKWPLMRRPVKHPAGGKENTWVQVGDFFNLFSFIHIPYVNNAGIVI